MREREENGKLSKHLPFDCHLSMFRRLKSLAIIGERKRRCGTLGTAVPYADRPHLWPIMWDIELSGGLFEVAKGGLEAHRTLALKKVDCLRVPQAFMQRNECNAEHDVTEEDFNHQEKCAKKWKGMNVKMILPFE